MQSAKVVYYVEVFTIISIVFIIVLYETDMTTTMKRETIDYDNYPEVNSEVQNGQPSLETKDTGVQTRNLMDRRFPPPQEIDLEIRGPPFGFKSPVKYIPFNDPRALTILAWSSDDVVLNALQEAGPTGCLTPSGNLCKVTADKLRYNESDAILIKLSHEQGIKSLPSHRFSNQKWVAYEVEAPPRCDLRWPSNPDIESIRYMFNLTSTFSPDSTVPTRKDYWARPYCGINLSKYRRFIKDRVNYSSGKTRNVAWFVSHCETHSQREDYVRELQKYIDVDIYGSCGNFTCGDNHHREGCDETIVNSTYRFYLSLENSLCHGYVTEKLWRFLSKPIFTIPVVFGYTPYRVFLPEKTVIDAAEFESPKALADKLKNIANAPMVFNDYIMRKMSMKHLPDTEYDSPYICRLCDHLHQNANQEERILDVKAYWNTRSKCVHPWQLIPGDFWTLK